MWYFLTDGQNIGPISDEHIATVISTGVIGPETFVWCASMDDWMPARETLLAHFFTITPENLTNTKTDSLLEECIELMTKEGQASISLFQRRLRISYRMALKIMSVLEATGYVSPGVGAMPRKIIKHR